MPCCTAWASGSTFAAPSQVRGVRRVCTAPRVRRVGGCRGRCHPSVRLGCIAGSRPFRVCTHGLPCPWPTHTYTLARLHTCTDTLAADDDMETVSQRYLSAAIKLGRPPNACVVFAACPTSITGAWGGPSAAACGGGGGGDGGGASPSLTGEAGSQPAPQMTAESHVNTLPLTPVAAVLPCPAVPHACSRPQLHDGGGGAARAAEGVCAEERRPDVRQPEGTQRVQHKVGAQCCAALCCAAAAL